MAHFDIKKRLCTFLLLNLFAGFNFLFAQEWNIENEIPILAWHSFPAEESSLERFLELREAGFNINFTVYPNKEEISKALDLAQKANVKLLVSYPALASNPDDVILFKDHPATGGYYIQDEPSTSEFKELRKIVKRIQSKDKLNICYINLFPIYATPDQLGTKYYKDYVREFISDVPVTVISFDHYPIVRNKLRDDWFENLEIISQEARKVKKTFWGFILSVSFNDYLIPDIPQLRLQAYSNLVYGAQGLQYFTYWTPGQTTWNFNHGLLTYEGKRTDVYNRVKQLNKEIKAISKVFKGGIVESIFHTDRIAPAGVKSLRKPPKYVKSLHIEGNAIVSEIKNKEKQYLCIVNKNLNEMIQIDITLDGKAEIILKDGSSVKASLYSNKINISPGDILIYRLQ